MKQPFLKIQTLCFLFSFYAQYGHPYRLECPKTVQWKLRAKNLCNSNDTDIYYCLKDILKQEYVEGCTGPDWDRKGCKRVISGDFTRDSCSTDRYQPFDFWSNGNTDCVYSKSQCAGQGQLINNNGSGYLDTTCRCDFARGYNYTKLPEDICNCKPVLEDCSCFRDDNSNVNGTKLLDPQYLETNVEDDKDNNLIKYAPSLLSSFQVPRRNAPIGVRVLVFFTLVFSLCVILFLVDVEVNFLSKLRGNPSFKDLFCTADSKQGNSDKSSDQKDGAQVDIESNVSSKEKTDSSGESTEKISIENGQPITVEEINYLRIVQLILGVACPVVRMVFNDEIRPNKLSYTINALVKKIKKSDRRTYSIFFNNSDQFVSSETFDIKFMVRILKDSGIIRIAEQLPPVRSDTKKDALLSRILQYRNIIVGAVDGKLNDEEFHNYLKEIGQTVLRMAANHLDIINKNKALKDSLLALSPIKEDDIKLQRFVLLTERFPQLILQQIIEEYCFEMYQEYSIIQFLKDEKHIFLHKRKKQSYCCMCDTKTFTFTIPEKLWNKLYMYQEKKISHTCRNKQKCLLRYEINFNFDLSQAYTSVLITLVLNSPRLLRYMVKHMFTESFACFLEKCKHSIFHSVETIGGSKCHCCNDKDGVHVKAMLTKDDWNKLFISNRPSSCTIEHCCCLFSAKDNVDVNNLDDTLLHRIMNVAGPFRVFEKCKKNPLNIFLCWDGEYKEFIDASQQFLGVVKDTQFARAIQNKFSMSSPPTESFGKEYVGNWILRNVSAEKSISSSRTDLVLLFQDGGRLATQNVTISNMETVHFSNNSTIVWTQEEANFLKVNYLLNQIICPIIRNEFDRCMPSTTLDKIITDIYYRDLDSQEKQTKDKNRNSEKEPLRLTSVQRNRIFLKVDGRATSKDLDLSLVIRIFEENKNTIDALKKDEYLYRHLKNIKDIRNKIVHSPTCTLDNTDFHKYWKCLSEAILSLNGEEYQQRLNNLETHDILKIEN